MTIGQRIKEARESLSLSPAQLAKKLNCTPRAVIRWENDENFPSLKTIKDLELLNIVRITLDEIGYAKNPLSFSERVKKFRERTGMTRKELGQRVDASEWAVDGWEEHRTPPTDRQRRKFSRLEKLGHPTKQT